jgi:hypothetical protein
MKPLNMAGAHPAWAMMANLHRPPDVTEAIRALAAQGLKPYDIASSLRIGVVAVEQALRTEVQA